MTTGNCLNCDKELEDKFCSGCGQQADTHRISFKNFIMHDVMHGTFHLDKGILFTARQALVRPGQAALDYIAGKRKRFYNVFYLILITIGVMLFIRHYGGLFGDSTEIVPEKQYINEASRRLDEIFAQKSKIILLLFVPVSAINSFILFRRKKLNLSEHFIISGMILLGVLLISTMGNLMFSINMLTQINGTVLSLIVTAAIIIYIGFGYYNAFSADYTRLGVALRIFLYFALICIEVMIMLYILVGIATDWKMGRITIAPFG